MELSFFRVQSETKSGFRGGCSGEVLATLMRRPPDACTPAWLAMRIMLHQQIFRVELEV